jgi:PAS domain-containing protein
MSASDWLWETDAEHRFTWLSPNVEDLVGVPPEWHYGKTVISLIMAATACTEPFGSFIG